MFKLQGTSSTNYFMKNNNIIGIIKSYLGIPHTHRYDIPAGYNQKLGTIYEIALFDADNNLIAICQKHPIEGEEVLFKQYGFGFDIIKPVFLSAHRDHFIDEYKVY